MPLTRASAFDYDLGLILDPLRWMRLPRGRMWVYDQKQILPMPLIQELRIQMLSRGDEHWVRPSRI